MKPVTAQIMQPDGTLRFICVGTQFHAGARRYRRVWGRPRKQRRRF